MSIYKRIIVIVSATLFGLLALLATMITDLNDRDFPQAIGSESRLTISFDESEFSIVEAFLKLEELDKRLTLGLVKISPDLAGNSNQNIFVPLNDKLMPDEFTWFNGDDAGKIVGKERLKNSYPDGVYLVTGNTSHLNEFENMLRDEGVKVVRRDASFLDSLLFVLMERGFIIVILASLALISSLALFWLSMKARGRALRVLGGCPTIRIQLQDFAGFSGALFISAGLVAIIATGYIGIFHGWIYVTTFLKILLSMQTVVMILSMLIAFMMAAATWPSATMLATRQPAIKRFRSVAMVIQAITFILVVASAGPAWSAYKHASTVAADMKQWEKLVDQVAIVFATDIGEMDRMDVRIGEMIKDAESLDAVALSYTYMQEMWPSVDFGKYAAISFVNQRWLDLVTKGEKQPVVAPVSRQNLPDNLVYEIREEINMLSREEHSENLVEQLQFLQPLQGARIPVARGGESGSLYFGDDVLFVVVPWLYNSFSDFNLTSMISSRNIVFTGVTATQQVLERHYLDVQALRENGFKGELQVVYIAEEGILQAQFATYLVWLQSLSLIALLIAFSVATAIHALITATQQAKRDFPLRLAGFSWIRILQSRIVKELLIGIMLVIGVVMLQRPHAIGIILIVAAYGLLIVPFAHLFAVSWSFNGVSKRRI